jgi:hypothetical protein
MTRTYTPKQLRQFEAALQEITITRKQHIILYDGPCVSHRRPTPIACTHTRNVDAHREGRQSGVHPLRSCGCFCSLRRLESVRSPSPQLVCNKFVHLVTDRDPTQLFHFAPLQSGQQREAVQRWKMWPAMAGGRLTRAPH